MVRQQHAPSGRAEGCVGKFPHHGVRRKPGFVWPRWSEPVTRREDALGPYTRNNLPGQEGAEERKTGQPYLRAMKSSAKPLHTSANLLTPLPDRLPMLREAATTVKMQSMLATH